MCGWLDHHGTDDHGFGDYISPNDPWTCGTTACALGWAATIPSFRRAGLRVHVDEGHKNIKAAAEFFEINTQQALFLFAAHFRIKTPKQWAKICRKALKEWA